MWKKKMEKLDNGRQKMGKNIAQTLGRVAKGRQDLADMLRARNSRTQDDRGVALWRP